MPLFEVDLPRWVVRIRVGANLDMTLDRDSRCLKESDGDPFAILVDHVCVEDVSLAFPVIKVLLANPTSGLLLACLVVAFVLRYTALASPNWEPKSLTFTENSKITPHTNTFAK